MLSEAAEQETMDILMSMGLKPAILIKDDRVWFKGEKQSYRVRCTNYRYAVCTKPFNPKHTVIYSIIDFEDGVRGTENLIFGMGFDTDIQCLEALVRLAGGETEVSRRNRVALEIERVERGV